MTLSNERIAAVLAVPSDRVAKYWPRIEMCLQAVCGNEYSDNVAIAALATIKVECPPFLPIHEYGTDERFEKLYGHRADLGNTHDGDGVKYAGRGFVQITGEANYAEYGKLTGVDLVHNPDDALIPDVAATIFAAYFHQKGCDKAANAGNWTRVRELVNGGHNALPEFLFYVQELTAAIGQAATAAGA